MKKLRPWEIDPNWTCPPYVAPKQSLAQKLQESWGYYIVNPFRELGVIASYAVVGGCMHLLGYRVKSKEDLAEEDARAEERGKLPSNGLTP